MRIFMEIEISHGNQSREIHPDVTIESNQVVFFVLYVAFPRGFFVQRMVQLRIDPSLRSLSEEKDRNGRYPTLYPGVSSFSAPYKKSNLHI